MALGPDYGRGKHVVSDEAGLHAVSKFAVWRDIRLGIFCGAVAPQGATGSSP